MKIYLATSWRNIYHAAVLDELRHAGHQVYDFKNPGPGVTGFAWQQCDPDLATHLTVERLRRVLAHPIAVAGFGHDYRAMMEADACVLLLPSGMSAHLEAGWMGGLGKFVAICAPEIREPELMYKCFDDDAGNTPIFSTAAEVIDYLEQW